MDKKLKRLKELKEEILNLKSSPLYPYRIENDNFPVIGEGYHNAKLMLVGEAPGKNEAKKGKPFCGKSGDILDEILSQANLKREKIYITNIVKDRPPENRDPTKEEIELYAPFLEKQIKIINPEIIGTLGRFSAKYLLNKYFGINEFAISKFRGTIYEREDMAFKIVPMYHPAATIYIRKRKEDLVKDFLKIKKILEVID